MPYAPIVTSTGRPGVRAGATPRPVCADAAGGKSCCCTVGCPSGCSTDFTRRIQCSRLGPACTGIRCVGVDPVGNCCCQPMAVNISWLQMITARSRPFIGGPLETFTSNEEYAISGVATGTRIGAPYELTGPGRFWGESSSGPFDTPGIARSNGRCHWTSVACQLIDDPGGWVIAPFSQFATFPGSGASQFCLATYSETTSLGFGEQIRETWESDVTVTGCGFMTGWHRYTWVRTAPFGLSGEIYRQIYQSHTISAVPTGGGCSGSFAENSAGPGLVLMGGAGVDGCGGCGSAPRLAVPTPAQLRAVARSRVRA